MQNLILNSWSTKIPSRCRDLSISHKTASFHLTLSQTCQPYGRGASRISILMTLLTEQERKQEKRRWHGEKTGASTYLETRDFKI